MRFWAGLIKMPATRDGTAKDQTRAHHGALNGVHRLEVHPYGRMT